MCDCLISLASCLDRSDHREVVRLGQAMWLLHVRSLDVFFLVSNCNHFYIKNLEQVDACEGSSRRLSRSVPCTTFLQIS